MEEERSVKLHGMWASPYVARVKAALKIKGIEYECIEEDLGNKSELLLKYNPVYKKVPVLVHNGLPIVESSIIVEYIDETWSNAPYLLPKDPYQRAKHRFWAAFLPQVAETLYKAIIKEGKLTKEILEDYWKNLDMAEEFIKNDIFPSGCPSFHDSKPSFLDLTFYCYFGTTDFAKELFGVEFLSIERYPLLTSWLKAISEVSEVKEVQPPKQKLIEHLRVVLEKYLPPKA